MATWTAWQPMPSASTSIPTTYSKVLELRSSILPGTTSGLTGEVEAVCVRNIIIVPVGLVTPQNAVLLCGSTPVLSAYYVPSTFYAHLKS